jgi:uncharacterized protein YaiE (UPF0345 family)
MREILFRGKGDKKYNDGMWYFGVPIRCYDGDWQICTDNSKRTVIPETVGQYTGLKDKNGTKIFEGDIIYAASKLDAADMVVVYNSAEFRLVLCEDYKTYKPGLGFKCYERFNMQVIGNIYDNPELLEGNNNG